MGKLFESPKREFNNRKSNVTDYIILDNTPITVQFLTEPVDTYKHWVFTDGRKLPFTCLGLGQCPICARNEMVDDPDHDPDFIERQHRYAANVVDLSPVKVCPECETVNSKNATKCQNDECNAILVEVEPEPLKMVRYLEGSYTLYFADLAGTEEVMLEADPSLDLRHVPLTIKKQKSENVTSYPIVPQLGSRIAVDPDEYMDQLHDLSEVGITLTYGELEIIMNGGSFKEVMAARRDAESPEPSNKEELDELLS